MTTIYGILLTGSVLSVDWLKNGVDYLVVGFPGDMLTTDTSIQNTCEGIAGKTLNLGNRVGGLVPNGRRGS